MTNHDCHQAKIKQPATKVPPKSKPCICDFPKGSATVKEREKAEGHYNEAGGYCCPHNGNTCGYCHRYDS